MMFGLSRVGHWNHHWCWWSPQNFLLQPPCWTCQHWCWKHWKLIDFFWWVEQCWTSKENVESLETLIFLVGWISILSSWKHCFCVTRPVFFGFPRRRANLGATRWGMAHLHGQQRGVGPRQWYGDIFWGYRNRRGYYGIIRFYPLNLWYNQECGETMGYKWEKNRILGGHGFPKSDKKWGMGQKTSVLIWGDVDPMSRGMTEPTPTRSNSENMLPPSTSMVKP